MCRYGLRTYKPHYVCFDCRKTFKQPILEDLLLQNGDLHAYKLAFLYVETGHSSRFKAENPNWIDYFEEKYTNRLYKCPDCGKKMNNIGKDFRAPKKEKVREWQIVESMYQLGNTFHSCGCYGPGYIPRNKRDYLVYLEKTKSDYLEKLNNRKNDGSENELSKYLIYWNTKLQAINQAIHQIKRNAQ